MSLSRITVGLLLLLSATGLRPALAEPRTVMTISGGVSLGVYEAGLIWGLTELLRQQSTRPRGAPLTAVTGASAGSINALVAAMHYCAADTQAESVQDNLFRSIWLPVGLDSLLPAQPRAYDRLAGYRDGVLTREPLREAIDGIRRALDSGRFREGCRIRLGFVVTRNRAERFEVESIDVRSQRFIVPLQAEVVAGRLVFRNFTGFAERDRTPHLLLHTGPDARVDPADVIRAALASSAFPIAFGRVRLNHCALQTGAPSTAQCPEGYSEASTTFVDGGVFDNVPLGAAMLLGEADAPASLLDTYQYMYIDPDFRRTATPSAQPPVTVAEGTLIPETDHYGLLDQTAFVLDALVIAHRNELYSTLRSNDWGESRNILLLNRYSPLTADFLRHFGAFVDPEFRRFDYYVGVYDAVINTARQRCARPDRAGADCLHQSARESFEQLQLQQDPAARTIFLALARHEFCGRDNCLNRPGWAWLERMPPQGDALLGQIFALLSAVDATSGQPRARPGEVLTPPPFVEFLRRLKPLREQFSPSLQKMIEHPERWHHAYLRRSALRLKALEEAKQADLSPEERAANAPFVALTGLLNFGVHTMAPEAATEAWPVSTAPPGYAWYLPDEVAIDGSQTGAVLTWRGYLQPVSGPLYLEWELAPLHWVRDREDRANFIHGGVNLRWRRPSYALSSLGLGGGLFFNWNPRDDLDNQGLLINLNLGLLADKLRLGMGYKIIDSEAGDERFLFTIGITDLKGWFYWF